MSAKSRLSVYVEPARLRQLEAYARQTGQSKSLVAEAAIAAFLEPPAHERHEAALMRRLSMVRWRWLLLLLSKVCKHRIA